MTETSILRILRSQWKFVVGGLLLGLVVAGTSWLVTPPAYVSTIDVYVSAQSPPNDTQSAYEGSLLSQQQSRSYAQLVTNSRVVSDVESSMGGQVSRTDLEDNLTSSAAPETTLIEVSYRSNDARQSADVVNAVGRSFTKLIAELERPADPRRSPTVLARIVQLAEIPSAPVGPSAVLYGVVGLVGGLLVGSAAAIWRYRLSTTVRSERDLIGASTLSPVIGTVPSSKSSPDATRFYGQGIEGEEFRRIRTNLQYMSVDRAARTIVITSALPGDGKTSVCCGLASVFAAAGARTIVVEADLRKPSISDRLGLSNDVGLTSVLSGRAAENDCVHSKGHPFDILTSGPLPPNPSELVGSAVMAALLERLLSHYDRVVIDTPPVLPVTDASLLARQTDGVVMVSRAGRTTLQQLIAARDRLTSVEARYMGLILNFTAKKDSAGRYGEYKRDSSRVVGNVDSTTTVSLNAKTMKERHRLQGGEHSAR